MAISNLASTVFGVLYGADGNPAVAQDLVFRPSSTKPRASVAGVVSTASVTVTTNASGFFTTTLMPGKYFLRLAGADPVPLLVPSAVGNYFLQNLVAPLGSGISLGVNYRDIGSTNIQRQLLSTNGNWYVPYVVITNGVPAIAFGLGSDSGGDANFTYVSGCFKLLAADGSAWIPFITGNYAAPAVALATASTAAFTNSRITGGNFQLLNPLETLANGNQLPQYHTWFLVNTASALAAGQS